MWNCDNVCIVAMSREQRGGRSELVFSFHLLLCCVEYVILLTPSFQLKPPFGTLLGIYIFSWC